MKIALITCSKHPLGVEEDAPLFKALNQSGIAHDICVWDQANDWSAYDVLLLRSVWDYHERKDEFLRWCQVRSQHTLLLNPLPAIAWNSNKNYLKALSQAGLSIAPTHWFTADSENDVAKACQQLGGEQWFLKPTVGADSSGTLRFDASQWQQAQNHLEQHLNHVDMMLQPYLSSVENRGEVSLIYFGQQWSHAVIKNPVAGDYRVQDTFGASDHPYQPTPAELEVSSAVVDFIHQQFDGLCYARVDLLNDAHGHPLINEVELIEPSLFLHHAPVQGVASFIRHLLNNGPQSQLE